MEALRALLLAALEGDKCVGPFDAVYEAASAQDHPLVDHFGKGFIKANDAEVREELGPESAVQQVACSVFCSPNVEVNLSPVVALGPVTQAAVVVRVHVPQEVPARSSPARHGIELHALTPGDIPMFSPRQRRITVLCGQVSIHLGQKHLFVFNQLRHALIIEDGKWLAPVSLAAEYRVAQPVVHLWNGKSCSL